MNERGFAMLELLVACALLLAVTGAVAAIAIPLRAGVERSLGTSELTGGGRSVLDRLATEIREAGRGAEVGGTLRLLDVMTTIVPLATLGSAPTGAEGRAVRLTRVPGRAPQATLRTGVGVSDIDVQLETTSRCHNSDPTCGLRAGMTAVLYDDTHAVLVSVHSVAPTGIVRLSAGLPSAFAAGSIIAAVSTTAYGLRNDPDGSFRLVRVTPAAEQPVLQSVVDFQVTAIGTDARHVQQVDLVLRIEAESAHLRGPAGYLFRRAGTALRPAQWVPDVELRWSVAVRNVTN